MRSRSVDSSRRRHRSVLRLRRTRARSRNSRRFENRDRSAAGHGPASRGVLSCRASEIARAGTIQCSGPVRQTRTVARAVGPSQLAGRRRGYGAGRSDSTGIRPMGSVVLSLAFSTRGILVVSWNFARKTQEEGATRERNSSRKCGANGNERESCHVSCECEETENEMTERDWMRFS